MGQHDSVTLVGCHLPVVEELPPIEVWRIVFLVPIVSPAPAFPGADVLTFPGILETPARVADGAGAG